MLSSSICISSTLRDIAKSMFHNSCATLHSHQLNRKDPVAPHPLQCLVLSDFGIFVYLMGVNNIHCEFIELYTLCILLYILQFKK